MNTENIPTHCETAIVGGGPVGLGLAIDLSMRGVKTLLVERTSDLHRIPKGQNLTQRTGEHFRCWKVSRQIREASPIPRSFGNAGMVAYQTLLGDYHYDWFKRGSVNDFYFAENERLPQYETEKVLRRRAEEIDGLTVLYDAVAEKVSADEDRVGLQIRDRSNNRLLEVTSDFLVGCDGSRSMVRNAAQIGQDIDPHDRRMVLLVFKSRHLHTLLERYPGKSIYNILNPELDGYWQFLGRVDLDGTWFYHAPVPQDTTRDNFDFAAYLHQSIGAAFELQFEHIGFWDLRIASAHSYRNGRIFIAGDAAHSHPPYGGYGVNTGFEDARNLSWKLAAHFQGWAGSQLLDSYTAERKAVFDSTSAEFIQRMIIDDRLFGQKYSPRFDKDDFERAWKHRASAGNADVTQYLPHYEGSPLVTGPAGAASGARGIHKLQARCGHHLAPQLLSDGRDLFDALGRKFALLAFDANPVVVERFLKSARRRRIPLNVVTDNREAGRDQYEATYIVVRPDHFIAWAGQDPAGLEDAILGRAVGDVA